MQEKLKPQFSKYIYCDLLLIEHVNITNKVKLSNTLY